MPALVDDRGSLELDLPSAELVVEHLGSDDPMVVLAAMNTLERRGRGGLIPSLVLRHPDERVLQRALEIFAVRPARRERDWHSLAGQLIEHPDDRVRFAAASALAAQGKLDFDRLASDSAPGRPRLRGAPYRAPSARTTTSSTTRASPRRFATTPPPSGASSSPSPTPSLRPGWRPCSLAIADLRDGPVHGVLGRSPGPGGGPARRHAR